LIISELKILINEECKMMITEGNISDMNIMIALFFAFQEKDINFAVEK